MYASADVGGMATVLPVLEPHVQSHYFLDQSCTLCHTVEDKMFKAFFFLFCSTTWQCGHICPGTFCDTAHSGSETYKCHSFYLRNRYICEERKKRYQTKCVFPLHSFFSSQIFSNSKYLMSYTGDVFRFIEATTKTCSLFVQI